MSQLARNKSEGITLAVDFVGFMITTYENCITELCGQKQIPHAELMAGEYVYYSAYLKNLLSKIKEKGINLIFFTDGASGVFISSHCL